MLCLHTKGAFTWPSSTFLSTGQTAQLLAVLCPHVPKCGFTRGLWGLHAVRCGSAASLQHRATFCFPFVSSAESWSTKGVINQEDPYFSVLFLIFFFFLQPSQLEQQSCTGLTITCCCAAPCACPSPNSPWYLVLQTLPHCNISGLPYGNLFP